MVVYISIVILFCIVIHLLHKLEKQKAEFQKALTEREAFARKDALDKSRSTITGAIVEKMAPIIPGWLYNGRDTTHVGSPLDFIVFNGMSTLRDTGEGEIEIVLIDVKTGNAQLTPMEKAIKDACESGRVRWETLRFKEDRGGLVPVKHRKKKIEEITVDEEVEG